MPDEAFLLQDGMELGPFSPSQLKALAVEGRIRPDDLIRKGHDGQPIPARKIAGLADAFEAATSQTTAPSQQPGQPADTAWLSEVLATENEVGPTDPVSKKTEPRVERPVYAPKKKSEPAWLNTERIPDNFDPYHVWLGIPKGKRPPTHYQLLRISSTEHADEVVEGAAERQAEYIRKCRIGEYGKLADRILYEIEEAKHCLLNPRLRKEYDEKLAEGKPTPAKKRVLPPPGHPVGEQNEIVRTYFGIVSIILAAFIIMAVVTFMLPWKRVVFSKSKDNAETAEAAAPAADQPVAVAAANVGNPPQKPKPPVKVVNAGNGPGGASRNQRDQRIVVVPTAPKNGEFGQLSVAIGAAAANELIELRPGTHECGDLRIDRSITISGAGAKNVTIRIAGTLTILDDSVTLRNITLQQVTEAGSGSALLVENSKPTIEDCTIMSDLANGIKVVGASSAPTLRHCIVRGCQLMGLVCENEAQASIEDCVFSGNKQPGVWLTSGANPLLRRCEISGNEHFGIVVHTDAGQGGRGRFEECNVFGNKFNGFVVDEGGSPELFGCKIHDNHQDGCHVRGECRFDGCDFFRNSYFGLRVADGGSATLSHCNIHDNDQLGGQVGKGAKVIAAGCNIYGNKFHGLEIYGDLVLRQSEAHQNGWCGLAVMGTLSAEEVHIYGHGHNLAVVGGKAELHNCRIENASVGVEVKKRGKCKLVDCTLTNNRKAYTKDSGSTFSRQTSPKKHPARAAGG
jgi:parallel beta-helix repeat protein